MRIIIMAALCALPGAAPLAAHPGGLNGEGCHNNRKTGGYHCHSGGGGSTKASPARQYAMAGGGGGYRNCTAARNAGAAPVRIGEPGYGRHLDRDGDGIGCE